MNPLEAIKFQREPRKHQKDALVRFAPEPEMALLWEMGTGKSTENILWARIKYASHGQILRTLVISPVATLYNWLEEFKLNSPERIVEQVLVPYMKTQKTKYTNNERARIIASTDKKIIVLNPESLDSKEVVVALQSWAPEIFILDESQRFKSHKSKRLKALLSITDPVGYRTINTGTPILVSYLDIWAQWRILDEGETFGRNFFVFRETYFRDENLAWKGKSGYFPSYVPRADAGPKIAALMNKKASRITKEECLDLPPLIHKTMYVELADEQQKAYKAMEDEMLVELKNGHCAATNALSRVLRMLQIISGHLPFERDDNQKSVQYFTKNPRLDQLRELLEELTPHHKVIVWATFEANYELIRKVLAEMKLEHAELVGGTKDRQGEIVRFQTDDKCRVMLSNPQAGGVGVNLTAASYAIYYSRNFSLGDRLQSEARNHRGGSEHHKSIVLIDLVVKDSIDEDVLAALLRKENFSDAVLDKLKYKYRVKK